MLRVEIHPLHDDELLVIEHFLAKPTNPSIHANRLARQNAGEVTYLVAWRDNMPMGHLLIEWNGPHDTFIRQRVAPSPYLEDAVVLNEFQSLAVGSQLLLAAEELIEKEGYSAVGLAVDVSNHPAIALYKKHGYTESDIGPFIMRGQHLNEDNEPVEWQAECLYVTKTL